MTEHPVCLLPTLRAWNTYKLVETGSGKVLKRQNSSVAVAVGECEKGLSGASQIGKNINDGHLFASGAREYFPPGGR